ncbi:NifB/NifX family molybdenum-iron cluster-binding protein [bacterium]|nr:NifB/NifX family molybdenum-iron cluster-binding protein [bacterium]
MKVAIPIWQDRVSPVFDSSRRLLVVDVVDRKTSARKEIEIGGEAPERIRRLDEASVELLICGAISEPLAKQVLAAGIRVIPFIAGEVDKILRAYMEARLPSAEFLMPGCCAQTGHEPKSPRHKSKEKS